MSLDSKPSRKDQRQGGQNGQPQPRQGSKEHQQGGNPPPTAKSSQK